MARKRALDDCFRELAEKYAGAGAVLLHALDRTAPREDDWIGSIELDEVIANAARQAARQDPEAPLDQKVSRSRFLKFLQELERAGWGRVIVGRRGRSTRFVFADGVTAADLDRALAATRPILERAGLPQHSASVPREGAGGPELARDRVVPLLRANADKIRGFGVRSLALFGSVARNEARPDSDVDLLVSFDGAVTSDRFFRTKFFLEDLLAKRIDLVTESALDSRVRRQIESELVHVA